LIPTLITVESDPVTGITLNRTSATITVGQLLQLSATVAPANVSNKTVTWSSTTIVTESNK